MAPNIRVGARKRWKDPRRGSLQGHGMWQPKAASYHHPRVTYLKGKLNLPKPKLTTWEHKH